MIVVPYTNLEQATIDAVPDALFVEIHEENSYRQLLDKLWEQGQTFTLVEHDVVPTRKQLDELENCPHEWCGYGYVPGDWTPVFGCIRFRQELIKALPNVWRNDWVWNQLDAKFAVYAREHGYRHHWHYPHVHHERFPHNQVENGVYEVARHKLTDEEELVFLQSELTQLQKEIKYASA